MPLKKAQLFASAEHSNWTVSQDFFSDTLAQTCLIKPTQTSDSSSHHLPCTLAFSNNIEVLTSSGDGVADNNAFVYAGVHVTF